MQYLMLLTLFPPDIVKIIYQFVLKDKSANMICYHIKSYYEKKRLMLKSIRNNIFHDNEIYNITSQHNICCLDFIYKNYYSKKQYDGVFWKCYLHLFSIRLMNEYKSNKNKNKNMKKATMLWFDLCKKHNINLKLSYPTGTKYCKSNNMQKIKSFKKFSYHPVVLDYYDDVEMIIDEMDTVESFAYIWRRFIQ